jgi:hypothetical protein
MKNLFSILLLTAASFAQASSTSYISDLKTQSFEELRANYDVELENDQVWFGGSIVSILDTCMLDVKTIRTISKRDIEEQDGDDFEVVAHGYLYKSIYSTRAVVDGDDVISEEYTINTTRNINIVTNDDDMDNDFLFSREYTIPTCN